MAEPYQRPVARIWRDHEVVGAGFLAPRGVVVTCAHVVNDALGRDQLDPASLRVRSASISPGPRPTLSSMARSWIGARPLPRAAPSRSLRRHRSPATRSCSTPGVRRSCPITRARTRGHELPCHGLSWRRRDAGAEARGTVRATDADGWHLVEAERGFGRASGPGSARPRSPMALAVCSA